MTTVLKNRELLIAECQGLVRSLALKIQKGLPRSIDLDDLISYGQVGLAEAARDFDPARGGQFTTFAYYRIRGAIYDGVSKMAWVSRAHYNRIKYQQMAEDVLRLQAESPAAGGPAGGLSWFKEVTSALAVVYLSTHADSDEARDPLEVEDRASPRPDEQAIDRETQRKLHELIDTLPEESRALVRATYFEGLTLTEAGQRLGIGKAWASRLHARALERLGRALRLAGVQG
jgi:RNA polymerase sigma factor for flagellar operon FliA